jgi:two-component sensor histidine kinase
MLSSKQALTLALAVNELATSALKYGALSNEAAKSGLSGRQAGWARKIFFISWQESGGPPVVVPVRGGLAQGSSSASSHRTFSARQR